MEREGAGDRWREMEIETDGENEREGGMEDSELYEKVG